MGNGPRVEIVAAHQLDEAALRRHAFYMEIAIRQAERSPEHPFGAVIISRDSGDVLAEGRNTVDKSPILHAETATIHECARLHSWVSWPSATLYTTAEPCPMCAAAITWAGVGEVVIGTSLPTLMRLGFKAFNITCETVMRAAPFYRGRVVTSLLEKETDALYTNLAARLAARGR